MGMYNKGDKIKKWIDLDSLPHDSRGRVQWKKSVGCEVQFIYNDISGVLKILKCEKYTDKAIVFIDGYTNENGKIISVDQLKTCSIGGILRRPIIDTHPELVEYFVNIEDTYKYSAHSGKKVEMICPICGTVKEQIIEHLTDRGFSCPVCSDGISWPEKFMYNILKQIGITFKKEITNQTNGFEWVDKYKYDFYFEKDDKKYFIEMDGGFHFADTFRLYKQSLIVDLKKDNLAKNHGVNMIRINCDYKDVSQRFQFVKNSIVSSKLASMFHLSNINWDGAGQYAVNSYIVQTAKMWNDGICNKQQIAKNLGVSCDAVKKYLLAASEIGMCNYSKEFDKSIWINNLKECNSKPVMLFKDNIPINVFLSASELDRQSVGLYGKRIMKQHAGEVCRGDRKQTCGYTMKYITREEYEQLLPQFNKTIQN